MNSVKLISVLCLQRNIFQRPLIINKNKILIFNKSFTLPIKDFKLYKNRYFSDKKPNDPKAGLKAESTKPAPKAAATPDPKAAPKAPAKTDAKPTACKPVPKAAAKTDAKPSACKPVPKAAAKTDPKAAAAKKDPKADAKAGAAKKAKEKPKPTIDKKAAEKVAQLQMHFQKDDGKPIFLKMGARDMILYRTTCGLAIVGTLATLHFIFTKIW